MRICGLLRWRGAGEQKGMIDDYETLFIVGAGFGHDLEPDTRGFRGGGRYSTG